MNKLFQSNKILLSIFLFFLILAPQAGSAQADNRFELSKNLDVFNSLMKEVEMSYVDSIDVEKTVRRGIDAMLSGLDPYTEYIPEQEMGDLKFITTGEYGGIGSFIRERDGGVYIIEPFEGMPAALAGLKAGDKLLEIDGTDVSGMSSDKVSELLKGKPNTKMSLKILRPNEKKPRALELIRKQVLVDQVTYYGVRNDSIGYIYLKGFTDKSAQEVKAAFEDLKKNKKIKSLVFDLRNNGGGLLDNAVQIVGMFVPKGEVVLSTKGKNKQFDRTYRTAIEPLDTVIPIAVLINGGSASAAEIVSGALQDLDRAVLVGQRSFGKGLVQSTRELPFNGNLKVTISKYYIPSGRCIQAIDYAHKNEDGSSARIPDSLTTVFNTSKGRLVRDGGGVRPDFEVEEAKVPTIMYYLVSDMVAFDFATEWAQRHPSIGPIESFELSDVDYQEFKKFAKDKNFTYDRQSEKVLKNLKEVAGFEGYLDESSEEFKAIEAKLTPNLDRDLDRFKDQISEYLASEIVKRYYYQKGELIQSLKKDKVLDKSLEVLGNQSLYQSTLSVPTAALSVLGK